MGEHIFLARDFFDEDDIRDLLASPDISTAQRLRDISLERGVILSKDSDQESLIKDVAIIPFDWGQLNRLTRYLDKEDKNSQPRTVRISGVEAMENIDAVLENYKKRVQAKVLDTTYTSAGDNFATVRNTYIQRKPGLVKGLQREKVPTEISIVKKDDYVEISYGKDDKSEELAALFLASVRQLPNADKEMIQKEVALEGVRSAELKTKFFMDLILGVPELIFASSPKVRIHKSNEDDDLDDLEEVEDEGENKKLKATEKAVAGKIESASLKGDNVLLTKLYKELAADGYFIGSLIWEAVEKAGDKRKIIVEISFTQPVVGKGFCVDVKGIYDKNLDGDYKVVPRLTRKSESDKIRSVIMSSAYKICDSITAEK